MGSSSHATGSILGSADGEVWPEQVDGKSNEVDAGKAVGGLLHRRVSVALAGCIQWLGVLDAFHASPLPMYFDFLNADGRVVLQLAS
jgi:hypothetical protein